MSKEKKEEQEFLRNVERFLNGEEIVPDEDAGEDTRSTIEFARKLVELRADPSPEFQERLKSRLLRRLTEEEMAARERTSSGWLADFRDRIFPRSPVWRTAVVTVAILVAAVGVMWRTGMFTMTSAPGENGGEFEEMEAGDSQKDWRQDGVLAVGEEEEEYSVTAPSIIQNGVEVQVDIDVSSSDDIAVTIEPLVTQYGSEITLILTFRNTGSKIVTIDPVQPEIVVKNHDGELVYVLPAVGGPAELSPSESFEMLYVWEQQDHSGVQVPAGAYYFNIRPFVITYGTSSSEITLPPAEVVISEP